MFINLQHRIRDYISNLEYYQENLNDTNVEQFEKLYEVIKIFLDNPRFSELSFYKYDDYFRMRIIKISFLKAIAMLEDAKLLAEPVDNSLCKVLKARYLKPQFELQLSKLICDSEKDYSIYFISKYFTRKSFSYVNPEEMKVYWIEDILKTLSIKELLKDFERAIVDEVTKSELMKLLNN